MSNHNNMKIIGIAIAIVFIATAFSGCLNIPKEKQKEEPQLPDEEINSEQEIERSSNELKTFSSYEELRERVKNLTGNYTEYYRGGLGVEDNAMFSGPAKGGNAQETKDFSKTNIQVEGVDEADIVKTDGDYIYVVSNSKIVIVKAYPELKVVAEINEGSENPNGEVQIKSVAKRTNTYINEIFINKNKLIVFENEYSYYDYYYINTVYYDGWYYQNMEKTLIKIFDISDKTNPKLVRNISASGYYHDSRMIGDFIYIVINQYIYYDMNYNITLPLIENKTISATEISYFNTTDYSLYFTTILSLSLENQGVKYKTYLTSTTNNLYVSLNNIYATYTKYDWMNWSYTNEKTIIHKIGINNGKIIYKGSGEVPGHVLNQFSMDENNGNFRIATTVGQWTANSTNNVYVLDKNLSVIGKLEGIAKGERIYSTRFIGDKCYLVTFRQTDPFFVIDLTNETPKILGYLKIPGFSDYLHPYDDDHIIGVGKNTTEDGRTNGLKFALFDVSDVNNPKEKAKYVIDGWVYSEALYEHKAFLFSKTKNLLSIPIEEYGYRESNDYNSWYYWEGAYVLNLTLEKGFVLKGKIVHGEKTDNYYQYRIRRILYIEDNLYTISEKMIKVNKLSNMEEVGKLEI